MSDNNSNQNRQNQDISINSPIGGIEPKKDSEKNFFELGTYQEREPIENQPQPQIPQDTPVNTTPNDTDTNTSNK